MREQITEECLGLGSNRVLFLCDGSSSLGSAPGIFMPFDFAHRKILERYCLLSQRVDETSSQYSNFVHLFFQKEVACKRGNCPGFRKSRRVAVSKFGNELPSSSSTN